MAPRRRNPEGAWVLRAIAALLLLDDPHRDRLRRRALRSPHNTHARDRLYFHHGLLESLTMLSRREAIVKLIQFAAASPLLGAQSSDPLLDTVNVFDFERLAQ